MKHTFTARVAEFFQNQPHTWINGMAIAAVGGQYAWRSRISDCRRAFRMTIRNRQRTVRKSDGSAYVVSEYRFEPETEKEDVAGSAVARHS